MMALTLKIWGEIALFWQLVARLINIFRTQLELIGYPEANHRIIVG